MTAYSSRWRLLCCMSLIATLLGCAAAPPLRNALGGDSPTSSCATAYEATDVEIKKLAQDFTLSSDERTARLKKLSDIIRDMHARDPICWAASHEHHTNYDLFYAEFDDQGNAADTATGTEYKNSQIFQIKNWLKNNLEKQEKDNSGIEVVIFTHGWHGSSLAEDEYSIEFKGILQDIQQRENSNAHLRNPNSNGKPRPPFKVVGIEIAWRGDSFEHPTLIYPGSKNALNVWDRKVAAETISRGSVQELFAFLNDFYLEHSCHLAIRSAEPTISQTENIIARPANCSVHMLTIGHSFGALIDFHSLATRLYSGLNFRENFRAFGFGDMTVLLNPAFEGARYRPLFNSALNTTFPYYDTTSDERALQTWDNNLNLARDRSVQIPTLVILQSVGDTATGTFFPIFRHVTAPFEQTLGSYEAFDSSHAVGWVPDFKTHLLRFADEETPPSQAKTDMCNPTQQLSKLYCPFPGNARQTDEEQGRKRFLLLKARERAKGEPQLPPYMPLWSVEVSKAVMANHDDFWNPDIVRFIDTLFQEAYEQSERIHGSRQRTP